MKPSVLLALVLPVHAQITNLVLTNDDGWAVAQIRAQFDALTAAGYNVVLSAPTQDKSGTGSSTAVPTTLTQPCEFNSCPAGSPPEGFNATDLRLNWVNAFPVDSARYGIQTLAPKFFNAPPQLVVAGPNIGSNLGSTTQISGTVGAASEAAKEGIPSVAFSGLSNSHVSYTTLTTDPTSSTTRAALVNAQLTVTFLATLLAGASPGDTIVPANTTVSVNTAAVSSSACPSADDFAFVFTRNLANAAETDVETCGSNHLPTESSVVNAGCRASVTVLNAVTKTDVDSATQKVVFDRVKAILSCFDG